jgi:hypothetical protein
VTGCQPAQAAGLAGIHAAEFQHVDEHGKDEDGAKDKVIEPFDY